MEVLNRTHRAFPWIVGALCLVILGSSVAQGIHLQTSSYFLACNTDHLKHAFETIGLGSSLTSMVMALFPLIAVVMSLWHASTLTVMDVLLFVALGLVLSTLYQGHLADEVMRDITLSIEDDVHNVDLSGLYLEEGRLGRSSVVGSAALWGGLYLGLVFVLRIADERSTHPALEHLWFLLLMVVPLLMVLPLQAIMLFSVQKERETGKCDQRTGPALRVTALLNVVCSAVLLVYVVGSWIFHAVM